MGEQRQPSQMDADRGNKDSVPVLDVEAAGSFYDKSCSGRRLPFSIEEQGAELVKNDPKFKEDDWNLAYAATVQRELRQKFGTIVRVLNTHAVSVGDVVADFTHQLPLHAAVLGWLEKYPIDETSDPTALANPVPKYDETVRYCENAPVVSTEANGDWRLGVVTSTNKTDETVNAAKGHYLKPGESKQSLSFIRQSE